MRIQRLEESKQDIQNFIDKFGQDTYDLFIKSKDRLKNNKLSTDITWHTKNTSPEEMQNMLISLQQKMGNKDLSKTDFSKQQIPGKYKYLGEEGGYKIYQPLDYISSMALGVNTGWCTTGRYGHYGDPNFKPSAEDAEDHFNVYVRVHRVRLIYLLNPKTHYGEIAIAIFPRRIKAEGPDIESSEGFFGELKSANFKIFNAQDKEDYSLIEKIPKNLRDSLGLELNFGISVPRSSMVEVEPEDIEGITLLSTEEAEKLPESILSCGNWWWWLRSPAPFQCVAEVEPDGFINESGCLVVNTNAVRPALKISNLDSLNLEIGQFIACIGTYWRYIGNSMALAASIIGECAFYKHEGKGNNYEGSDIQKYLQNWLREQMSKNKSLKRGNKMTVEEYKKNRKARLQRLSEALDNLPEITDGKAHIEVDAVTGGAKAEAEDRKKQVKDSFKDKNKETREFIKKQDKDREVEKEDKSENRLMLDESLFDEIKSSHGDKIQAGDKQEFTNLLYDTLMNNSDYPSFDLGMVGDDAEVDPSRGEIVIPYGGHTYRVKVDLLESLNEKGGKKLNESLYSDAIDVVYDLVDRAKGWIDDGSDKDEAIQQAIDDGLIYSDDIFALARYFGGIDDSTLIESFYESLYELMYEKLGDYGRDDEEEDEEEDEE